MKKNLRLFLLIFSAFFILCVGAVLAQNAIENGSYEPDNKSEGVQFTLALDPSSVDLVEGDKVQLYPLVVGYQGEQLVYEESVMPYNCSWSIPSEGSEVASVDEGMIEALYEGETSCLCEYYVQSQGFWVTGTCTIKVTAKYPNHKKPIIIVEPAANDLVVGDTAQLTVYAAEENTKTGEVKKGDEMDPTTVTWTSSDDNVVQVDNKGLVTAVGEGGCFVSASMTNAYGDHVSDASMMAVSAEPPDNTVDVLVVEPASNSLKVGDQVQLSVYKGIYNFDNHETTKGDQLDATEVEWITNNGQVISVDETGLAKAVGEGQTYVMASLSDGIGNYTTGSAQFVVSMAEYIEMESIVIMKPGSTYQLNPKIVSSDALGTLKNNKRVAFTFSCTSFATVGVSKTGVLTAKKIGKVTVTCKSGNLEAKCQVLVVHPKYTVNAPNEIDVVWGEKVNLGATLTPNLGSLTYITNNEAIASVSKYGNVKGQSVGQTKVITIAPDGKTKKETKVNVIYPDYTIDLDVRGLTLYGGQTAQINATLTPNKGALKWKTSDKSIATVNAKGLVTARDKVTGQCEIMCIAPDGETMATVSVQVYRAEYTGLEVEDEIYMIGGEKRHIGYTLTPNKGKCIWESKDESMATVNKYGTVTAKRGVEGVVIIVCTSPDGLMQKECKVHITKN